MTTKDSMPPNHNPASLTREDFVLVSHTECCKTPFAMPAAPDDDDDDDED